MIEWKGLKSTVGIVDAGEMILSELMETCQNCQNSEIGRSFVNKVKNTKKMPYLPNFHI